MIDLVEYFRDFRVGAYTLQTGFTEAAKETWKQRMTIEHPMFVN